MKPRFVIKEAVDLLMGILLLLLMGYPFWGASAHEWIGVAMWLLFVAHHLLNGNWHRSLFKGTYTGMRIFTLCIHFLLFMVVIAQIYSGIVMSRYAFSFLPAAGNLAFARRLHILGSYWGFLLMSLHLGLHWKQITHKLDHKMAHIQAKIPNVVFPTVGAGIAIYGIFAFFKRDFSAYLFLKSEFVFFDYNESKLLFYLDYLAVMGLCIWIAHYGSKQWKHRAYKRRKAK